MNKISVFGSSGFIGGRFCEMYPHDVVKIPRDQSKPETNDILYFISTTDNYNIHEDLNKDIDTNLKVLMKVLEDTKKNFEGKITTINFISSWFVYGKNETLPFKENSDCNPTGFYSITKRTAEQLLICFCETFGYKYRILRLSNVLGENDAGVSKKKNAIQYMIRQIVENKEVSLYANGDILRDYMYVEDTCRAIKLCMDIGKTNEIYNIGNGKPSKISDIIQIAAKISKSSSKISSMEPTKFHNIVQVKDAYLDVSKLSELGFVSRYTIEDMVSLIVDHYKKQIVV